MLIEPLMTHQGGRRSDLEGIFDNNPAPNANIPAVNDYESGPAAMIKLYGSLYNHLKNFETQKTVTYEYGKSTFIAKEYDWESKKEIIRKQTITRMNFMWEDGEKYNLGFVYNDDTGSLTSVVTRNKTILKGKDANDYMNTYITLLALLEDLLEDTISNITSNIIVMPT